jgi:hypothetical protein
MIHETNDSFLFNKLILCKPIPVTKGSFLIRYSINEHPLYIQPPKCYIKQINTKAGKTFYCDLVFQQENEAFLTWIEKLENQTQNILYDHREQWFQTDLEKEDIERSFVSPMKMYNSGKEYIIRTNIQCRSGKPIVKIYDEDERTIDIENITENTKVMVILEVQGVRSSSKSFQIDIEIKQMMVLKQEEIFNTFILKKKTDSIEPLGKQIIHSIESPKYELPDIQKEAILEEPVLQEPILQEVILQEPVLEEVLEIPINNNEDDSFHEIDIHLDEVSDNDTIALKERKEMYYKMYEEARQKAKVARDLALSAYLEAKQIKNKYMLDDVLNSSSDESDESDGSDNDDE